MDSEKVCTIVLPVLIIIRGNSASGKTTIAKRLQQKFGRNTMLISQDVVRREMLKVKDGGSTEALPLMQVLLAYGKKHSKVTILEGIMYADWYKPLFECAAKEFKDNIFAYYFDLPFEETLKRHQTKPNCNDFGEEEMQKWWREKDYIGFIKESVITLEKTEEDIEELIYNQVTGNMG